MCHLSAGVIRLPFFLWALQHLNVLRHFFAELTMVKGILMF